MVYLYHSGSKGTFVSDAREVRIETGAVLNIVLCVAGIDHTAQYHLSVR